MQWVVRHGLATVRVKGKRVGLVSQSSNRSVSMIEDRELNVYVHAVRSVPHVGLAYTFRFDNKRED